MNHRIGSKYKYACNFQRLYSYTGIDQFSDSVCATCLIGGNCCDSFEYQLVIGLWEDLWAFAGVSVGCWMLDVKLENPCWFGFQLVQGPYFENLWCERSEFLVVRLSMKYGCVCSHHLIDTADVKVCVIFPIIRFLVSVCIFCSVNANTQVVWSTIVSYYASFFGER